MATRGQHYTAARDHLATLVMARAADEHVAVPATPGWDVHDVVAHLTGVAQDVVAGQVPKTGPSPTWTAGHVARGRDATVEDLVHRWRAASPAVERLLDQRPVWPLLLDVVAHEYDVRAALGDRTGRDDEVIPLCSDILLQSLQVPVPLVVSTERGDVSVGPGQDAAAPLRLRTTAFEAFRWRLGRRSRPQLASMDWTGDPAPVLDHLCVFGPAEADVLD